MGPTLRAGVVVTAVSAAMRRTIRTDTPLTTATSFHVCPRERWNDSPIIVEISLAKGNPNLPGRSWRFRGSQFLASILYPRPVTFSNILFARARFLTKGVVKSLRG